MRGARVAGVVAELAVVLAVLAVLYMLGGTVLRQFAGVSRAIACATDKRGVQNASAAYYAEHEAWAPDIDALLAAGLLTRPPGGTGYTVSYHADGTVTAAGACH
jgi:competence protein ComGC